MIRAKGIDERPGVAERTAGGTGHTGGEGSAADGEAG
jgi:hypothetical protein